MSSRRLLPLDGLRGLAVLMVFCYHVGGGAQSHFLPLRWLGLVEKEGWTGVTLFFVLSGFLITGILWDSRGEQHWWRNFYTRRVLRIFPLYYGSLLAVLVAAAIGGTLAVALSRIWSPLLFLQDIPGRATACINNDGTILAINHFWSLAVEEQFYLIWPFLLLLLRSKKTALRLCAIIFACSELLWMAQWLTPEIGRFLPLVLTRGGEITAGAWLAIAYRTPLWEELRRPAQIAAPLGLAIFAAGTVYPHELDVIRLPAITLCYAALLVLSLKKGLVARALSTRFICWLGTISYGIYVYHVLLGTLFYRLAAHLVSPVHRESYLITRFFVSAALTLLVSWLSFRFFERPFLRLKRRFPTEQPVPATVSS